MNKETFQKDYEFTNNLGQRFKVCGFENLYNQYICERTDIPFSDYENDVSKFLRFYTHEQIVQFSLQNN